MKPVREWRMKDHRGWGDRIGVWAQPKNGIAEFEGHTTPRVGVGDFIVAPLSVGEGRFRVTKVETFTDPPDMWFATAERVE